MSLVKEEMTKIINSQPEDSTYEEILNELAFAAMVERGLEDSRKRKVVSNEEVKKRNFKY